MNDNLAQFQIYGNWWGQVSGMSGQYSPVVKTVAMGGIFPPSVTLSSDAGSNPVK